MSTTGTPVLNLLSLADSSSCRSFKTLTYHHHLHFPILSFTKPLKTLTFSHSTQQQKSFSITSRNPNSPFVLFVAQTSDWAQQEEDNNNTVSTIEQQQQQEVEEEVIGNESESLEIGNESWGSENESGEAGGEGEEEEEEGGEEYAEPPEEAKIFVGNLPYDVDSEKLAMLFEQAGTVEIAEVIYNRETDRSRGFGFVTMSTVEEADKAVDMFHRYDLDGRFLTVNKAAPKGSRPERPPRVFEPAFRIYVGNLPWDFDDGRLEQVFSEHGKVVNARVVYERETGRSRGFGFVTMASETEMNDAIAALDGQSLDGRAIRVNVAEERPRRTF